jgi:hypothetical protein
MEEAYLDDEDFIFEVVNNVKRVALWLLTTTPEVRWQSKMSSIPASTMVEPIHGRLLCLQDIERSGARNPC